MKKIKYEIELSDYLQHVLDDVSDFEEDKYGNLTAIVLDRVAFQEFLDGIIEGFVTDDGYEWEGVYNYKIINETVFVTAEVE